MPIKMLEQIAGIKLVTVGGDKAYDTADFAANFFISAASRSAVLVLRYALLGAYVAKHIQLLIVFPRMPSSYDLELRMQESFSVPARFFREGPILPCKLAGVDGNSF